MYARAASSPELGYLVAQAIVKGSVPIEQPTLPTMPSESGSPPVKETREVWWPDGPATTDVYEMDDVRNGHTIEGPAVLEAEVDDLPDPARPPRLARPARHLPPREQGGLSTMATIDKTRVLEPEQPRPDRLGRTDPGRDAGRLGEHATSRPATTTACASWR